MPRADRGALIACEGFRKRSVNAIQFGGITQHDEQTHPANPMESRLKRTGIWIARPPQLVRTRPERLQLALDLGKGARKLLPACGMRRGFQLAAELGECEAERLGAAELLGIAIAFRHRAPGSLFLAFVHPLLDSILCVDKAFA